MNEFNPKVSIIIPVYNGSNYLREAIDSALAQTYKNIEVIVVNDGSNDGGKTEEIARSYGDKIRYFPKENGGVASALNLGIRKMTGEYFSWLSHDDVYCPEKVEVQINYLKLLNKYTVVLYSDWEHIDLSSNTLGIVKIDHNKTYKSIYSVMNCLINGCTLLVPKSCFDNVGLFDERLPTTQDYDLWFKMARIYQFTHIPEVLVKYRIHPQQDSIKHPLVLQESNILHTKFMRELTVEEILKIESSLSLFYIKRALFYRKNFPQAEKYAYKLFKEKLFKGNFFYIPYSLSLLLLYKIMPKNITYDDTAATLMLLVNPFKWSVLARKIINRLNQKAN